MSLYEKRKVFLLGVLYEGGSIREIIAKQDNEFIRKVEKRLKKEIDFPSRGLCVPSLQTIKRIITRVLKEEAGQELLE